METTFVPIDGPESWDVRIEWSRREPVRVFKHDPPCSISRVASRRLARLGREFPTIDVARTSACSRAGVADESGVWHESPRVLVPRDGEVARSALHVAITADAVAAALARSA